MRKKEAIRFCQGEHEQFYYEMLERTKKKDCYHQAFFYVMGITEETRNNIRTVFDFSEGRIRPEGLHAGWQTGSTIRAIRLAFNLWNGYVEEGQEALSTPYGVFDCVCAPYFYEGIKLRYPEYARETPESTKWMDAHEKKER